MNWPPAVFFRTVPPPLMSFVSISKRNKNPIKKKFVKLMKWSVRGKTKQKNNKMQHWLAGCLVCELNEEFFFCRQQADIEEFHFYFAPSFDELLAPCCCQCFTHTHNFLSINQKSIFIWILYFCFLNSLLSITYRTYDASNDRNL